MKVEETDVVVVGAGLAGLTAATFMALHGTPPLVLERNASTSVLPKARGQNPVTMEAMKVAGVDEAVRAATPPGHPRISSMVSESMSGPILFDHTANRPDFSRFSPQIPGLTSQSKVEAALADRAVELGARIDFNTLCEELVQDDTGVTLTVRSRETDEVRRIRCRYVVAADGIRGKIREWLGIDVHGLGLIRSHTAYQFRADLRELAGGNAAVIHYIQNPSLPDGTGVLVSTDWVDEWVANLPADPDRSDAEVRAHIRTMVGREDLDFEILGSVTYDYSQWVADRMQHGRVFLAGDAAHVMPPTGGQGGNTAQHDGYHLGWKLAAVVQGIAGEQLLDTYDVERRPYAEHVTVWQAANLAERRAMDDLAAQTGPPMDHATLLFGYVCPEGAFVPEAGASELFEDPATPSGRPGARVPHVQLQDAAGSFSPRDRLGPHFTVFATSADHLEIAQEEASALDVQMVVHLVESTAPLGTEGGGIVLVRPDGVVGWRGTDPAGIGKALRHVLCV